MKTAHPLVRLAAGGAGLLVAGALVHRDRVGPQEARAFRAVNDLPDALYGPTWTVMQCGNLAAAPVAAAVACATGRPRLAARMLIAGTATWALSKAVKRVTGRPRPGALVEGTRCRGREASGLGYVSGHAGVAVALAVAGAPELDGAGRVAAGALVPAVALSRLYVGAHLPLDVIGGASLGLVVDAIVSLLLGEDDRPARQSGRGHPVVQSRSTTRRAIRHPSAVRRTSS